MEPVKRTFDDLGGGLNQTEAPQHIADNQWSLLDNFIPFARRLIRRNGIHRMSLAAYPKPLTGLIHFRDSNGLFYPIVGTADGFARLAAAEPMSFLTIGALSAAPGDRESVPDYDPTSLWVFVPMNGVLYAMRKNNTHLIRLTPFGWGPAGIDVPSAAAVIAINASGVMTAGDREVVYTFRNKTTGAESDYSPISNTITLGDDDSIDVSGVAISSNPQVNQRRLYVTAPGTSGVYLYAGDIDDNVTTTANINKAVSELGALASVRNGIPPDDLIAGDIFLDSYLVATDGNDVFISEAFKPESFWSRNVFDVFRNDGHKVRAVRSWGDRVIIGKTNKVHFFTRTGANWNRDTLSDKVGCASHHSMQVAEGNLLIWDGGDDIYASSGGPPTGIGSQRIKKLLARRPAIRREFSGAAVYPKLGLYILTTYVDPNYLANPTDFIDTGAIPADRGGAHNVMLVYNYRTDAWCTFSTRTGFHSPTLLIHGYDGNFEQGIFSIHDDGHYYQMDRGNRDGEDELTIPAIARSKAHRVGGAGLLAAMRRVFLWVTTVSAEMTLRLYRDNEAVAVKERTNLPLNDRTLNSDDRNDKAFNMRTRAKGALWQLEIQYDGEPPVEIESYSLEAIPFAQRVRPR